MDIPAWIDALKGKVLDLKDIEILRHTYTLQEGNVSQLKTALDLARDRSGDLVKERERLTDELAQRDQRINSLLKENEVLRLWRESVEAKLEPAKVPEFDENDCVAKLRGWLWSLPAPQRFQTIHYDQVDTALKLPSGACKRHIEQAASQVRLKVNTKGANTILFQLIQDTPSVVSSPFRFSRR